MFQNILEQGYPSTNSNSIKLAYLQNQREQLSQLISELNTSIRLNKETISKMAVLTDQQLTVQGKQATFKEVVMELNDQNQILRDKNQRLIEDIESRQCRMLLQSQVRQQAEIQFITILKQYEDKILQLRRSMQDKQFMLQQRQSGGHQNKKNNNYIEPKQDMMKFHSDNTQIKDLLKKMTAQNSLFRQQNNKLMKINAENQYKISKLEALIKNKISFYTIRQLYGQQIPQKRSLSQQKFRFTKINKKQIDQKQVEELTKNKIQNKGFLTNSTVDGFYVRNQTINSLRSIIFKYKESQQILRKQLKSFQQQNNQLIQSNKLLRQSNIQHQIDRQKLQNQINFLKSRNHQLTSNINKRKFKRSNSNDKSNLNVIVNQHFSEIVPVQDRKQVSLYLASSQYDLRNQFVTIDSNISRNYLKTSKRDRIHRSFSCIIDYLPKIQVDAVQKYLNKKQSKQETKIDAFPFSIDYSMIETKNSPLTFADYRNKFKNKKFTQSFMMITEEILKM